MARHSLQIELDLRPPPSWGGARRGAGRKKSPSSGLPHLSRPKLARHQPCHVTLRLRRDLPSLRRPRFVRAFRRSLAKASLRPQFRVAHFSLQGNHAHFIVESSHAVALGRGMMAVGARLARLVNRQAGRIGEVLADRYHLHLLRTPSEVRRALAYVLLNHRHHAAQRGTSAVAGADPASSGAWFSGWKRRAAIARPPPDTPAGVAPPLGWLLNAGWRKHRLIDPAEVPGKR